MTIGDETFAAQVLRKVEVRSSCGRIPYVRTAEYFNRDPSSVAKDVLALEEALRESRSVREQVDRLARSLVKGSAA